jgi:hypothetical protein
MWRGRKECVRGRESVGKEEIISGWSERRKWGKKGRVGVRMKGRV